MANYTNEHIDVTNLKNALANIRAHGITTLSELRTEKNSLLYSDLWESCSNFISRCALKTTANRARVYRLLEMGVKENDHQLREYDLASDALVHVMKKTDYFLSLPQERQLASYMESINNFLVDVFRRQQILSNRNTSLNISVTGKDDDDITEIGALFDDPSVNIESDCCARETVCSCVSTLSPKRDELLAYAGCVILGHKPAEIADDIHRLGVNKAFANIVLELRDTYSISALELIGLLKDPKSGNSLDAHLDKKEISAQLSRLIYRASPKVSKVIAR